MFKDTDGEEEIYVHAEQDLNMEVERDWNLEIKGDKREIIRGNYFKAVNVGAAPATARERVRAEPASSLHPWRRGQAKFRRETARASSAMTPRAVRRDP